MTAWARRKMGVDLLAVESWQALWDESGLADRVVKVFAIDARKEVQARVRWVGMRWALRAIGRLIFLYLTNPAAQRAVKEQWSSTLEKSPSMGYGLFVGRKPEAEAVQPAS